MIFNMTKWSYNTLLLSVEEMNTLGLFDDLLLNNILSKNNTISKKQIDYVINFNSKDKYFIDIEVQTKKNKKNDFIIQFKTKINIPKNLEEKENYESINFIITKKFNKNCEYYNTFNNVFENVEELFKDGEEVDIKNLLKDKNINI